MYKRKQNGKKVFSHCLCRAQVDWSKKWKHELECISDTHTIDTGLANGARAKHLIYFRKLLLLQTPYICIPNGFHWEFPGNSINRTADGEKNEDEQMKKKPYKCQRHINVFRAPSGDRVGVFYYFIVMHSCVCVCACSLLPLASRFLIYLFVVLSEGIFF